MLCILQGYVLNLEHWASLHPGGEVILKDCAGQDITNLMLGNPTVHTITHSISLTATEVSDSTPGTRGVPSVDFVKGSHLHSKSALALVVKFRIA